ncbi:MULTISPECIES: hypothetical protein [unclassified Mycobacterium]|uniref:hypothetical protein n=1 Tax=unclassified Mycobacterium TaxID=2642494 RepID=UPI0029C935CF|nr:MULTISPECIES: hypothetical protein [unclassified Mycobacterium]
MTPDRYARSWWKAAGAAVLLAGSVVALRGHVPAGAAFGSWATVGIAVAVLAVALVVAIRPLAPRIAEWHRTASGSPAHFELTPEAQGLRPSTRSLVIVGSVLAVLAEFVAICLPGRAYAHALAGVAIGLVLLGMRGYLAVVPDPQVSEPTSNDEAESLQRWVSRTEALIHWSETTRSDWDRRVRPILARQFEMATKASQRRGTDPAAFQATGTMLFGGELWQWVDPDNVVRGGSSRPGPGRRTLEGILECLEQV